MGCFESSKKATGSETIVQVVPKEVPTRPTYQETERRTFDLIHTDLDVSFNWENRQLNGSAELKLKPWFHASNRLELDAKAMDIKSVSILDSAFKATELKYSYDSLVIDIHLDKEYTRNDTILIKVEYIANPERVKQKGSAAINDAKGLYFINHDGSHPNKPKQIWTQGETESSSCWFPTIDIPNEKMTQEISITVEDKYQTLSNGAKILSTQTKDGKRTDVWRQEKPHAPYLAMMAIGEFAIVERDWEDIKVHYFVEHKDSAYAELVFGRTPEMLTFFSERLGYKYPWEKYDQVIVQDFISGAMENTSAVIHGDFVMRDSIEYLDANYEDIVSHELFHHWFGDLLTCESWANLPLNESFATYGEYLWREHKYGNEFADQGIHDNLEDYLRESKTKMEDMIRFDFEDKEDMFDSHSYAKGGTILHMLRNYLGDEVFFASIEYYLHENAYQTVEIHDLRQAFEHISGEDLNWFFNQWFLDNGHPILDYSYTYDAEVDSVYITVKQLQDFNDIPLYKLPIDIDLYYGKNAKRNRIWVEEVEQTVAIPANGKPDNVNFDATKSITCVKTEHKSLEEWVHQYSNGKIYRDRYDALEQVLNMHNDSLAPICNEVIWLALDDPSDYIKTMALESVSLLAEKDSVELREKLLLMSQKDDASDIRASAISQLVEFELDDATVKSLRKSLADSSMHVKAFTIEALYLKDKQFMMSKVHQFNESNHNEVVRALSKIYNLEGSEGYKDYFIEKIKNQDTRKGYFTANYLEYLKQQDEDIILEAIEVLKATAESEQHNMYDRVSCSYVLIGLMSHYKQRITDLEKDLADLKSTSGKEHEKPMMEQRLKQVQESNDAIKKAMKSIMENASENEKMYYQAWMNKAGVSL